MAEPKKYKLDLMTVLNSLDNRRLKFYSELDEDEKKGYSPLILMRYMSSLLDQNRNSSYAVIATNDLVNIGFWDLSKYPDLQHLLLCLTGIGGKQYRPWMLAKRGKSTNKIDIWLSTIYPEMNAVEIDILKKTFNIKTWTSFVKSSNTTDKEVKDLIEAWKKQ